MIYGYLFLSHTTTQYPLSAGFMTILRSSTNPLIAFHFSLVRLYEVELPDRSENISPSI